MKAHRILLPLVIVSAACLPGEGNGQAGVEERTRRPDVEAALEGISAEDFARRVGVLAHDSMAGRATPSAGLDLAAAWIAAELQGMGLEGAGDDGGFLQRYPIPGGGGTAPNVVALLRGSDPALADEYVVFSAHMDHVGIGRPDASGDSIFNGADDNASGTTAILEIAEAMASMDPAPARSVIFLLVSGEEKGLWGSEHFATHPPVPLPQIVADLNLDMVGRNWADTIVVIGQEHSSLGEVVQGVSARHPELGMTAIDDLWPDERFFFRSDHYNFARVGVPALFFFNGVHEDYHRPSDSPDKIDVEKAARVARLVFRVGLEVAESAERPVWDAESRRAIVQERPGGS